MSNSQRQWWEWESYDRQSNGLVHGVMEADNIDDLQSRLRARGVAVLFWSRPHATQGEAEAADELKAAPVRDETQRANGIITAASILLFLCGVTGFFILYERNPENGLALTMGGAMAMAVGALLGQGLCKLSKSE